MELRAAVAGASGYAGGELLRLLLGHPGFALGPLVAGSSAGQPVTAVHPHLPGLAGRVFEAADAAALGSADIVFLALPHGQSAALARELPASVTVLDLGADHRLADPADWAAVYPGPYAGCWPYGLPELPGGRAALAGARRVALPGCYPTAVLLAVAPLLAAGLVAPDDLVAVAASGTSGSGRTPAVELLGAEVLGDLRAYKVGTHQHVPEMTQALSGLIGGPVGLSFTAVLAPLARGLLATITARCAPGVREVDLRESLAQAYAGEPFVHVLPAGSWPRAAATAGSNSCQLQVGLDARSGRAVAVAALDNLGKGAAGQALQCANLLAGFAETTGLTSSGVAP